MNPLADRTWLGQPNFYTAQYGYAKYHTMVTALEVAWEESGVARLRGLLRIGNQHWQNELHEGYPVDRVKAFIGHYVTSWGGNAAERRSSRVELWQIQGSFTQAVLYPQTDGRDTYFVATSNEAAAALANDLEDFLAGLKKRSDVDVGAVERFVRRGPEVLLAVDRARVHHDPATLPHHGIGFRLRLPYQKLKISEVQMNGVTLPRSTTDGWWSWPANGFTQVQISVPPEKADQAELYLITCEYKPDTVRRIGWTPPKEVAEKLRIDRTDQ